MCGILGVINHERLPNEFEGLFQKMLMSLKHRGPDWHDTWTSGQEVFLGHTRLSFLDLSPNGNQPMISKNGRFVITYNGEVYNLEELRLKLKENGVFIKGGSDTELVLECCALLGVKRTASLLNGMYAFCLYNRQEKITYLVRDRVGIKPLFWAKHKGGIAFSSEIKALTMLFNPKPSLSPEAVKLYFNYGYIPAPYTIFENINKLPPANILTFSESGSISITSYWCINNEAKRESNFDYNEFEDTLHSLLKDSIKKSLVADVPIGTFLSGGIDSSLVTAIAQTQSEKKISTFTIGFKDKNFNEANHAKEIANFLGTDHHELYFSADDLKQIITLLPQIYGEPFADSSALPTYLVSKLAKSNVKAVLSGDGGDEIFAGYNTYKRMKIFYEYFRSPISKSILLNVCNAIKSFGLDHIGLFKNQLEMLFKAEKLINKSNHMEAYDYLSSFLREIPLLNRSPNIQLLNPEFEKDITKDIQLFDFKQYLPDDILRKVDGASMAVSLEARVPLLDHRIIELGFQAPTQFKLKENKGKYPLRSILSKYIPNHFFERPKSGFSVNLSKIIKEDLYEMSNELLMDSSIEEYMDGNLVRDLLKEHHAGLADHKSVLWSIMVFQLWRAENAV